MQIENKLIADFLGKDTYVRDIDGYIKPLKAFTDKELRFNSSFDWLMIAVEKIESYGFIFDIKKNWVKISLKQNNILTRWEQDENKINAMYNGVIEFIKYYNEFSK